LLFILLLIVVCLAPLPFGAVQIGAWSVLAAASGALLAAWSVMLALGRAPPVALWRRLRWPLAAFTLTVVWIVLQMLPGMPEAWHHPIWAIGGEALGEKLPGRISIDPQAGLFGLIRLLSYGAIFWLAVQYGREPERAEIGLRAFTLASAAASGLGLVVWAAGLDHFLWFDENFLRAQTRFGVRLAVPFVNPNHLASFATIGLLCGVGLLAGETRGLWRPETAPREKLRRFFENIVIGRWYLVVASTILVAAVLLSGSRGGALSLVVGLVALAAALTRRKKPAVGKLAVGAVAGMLVLAVLLAPTLSRLVERIGESQLETERRVAIYEHTLEAIAASPLLGYGYGGFPALYRMYDTDDLTRVVDAAHSTILENVMELGVPGALLLFAAIAMPVVWCWQAAGTRRRDQHVPAIAIAVGAAVTIHSMVDFPLQIPAIAAAFSLVLGLGVAQSASSKIT
jgi:O-antigen ligase